MDDGVPTRSGPLLVIRADASSKIGLGHAMRCLALAEAWQDIGGQVTFVMAPEEPELEARIRSEGMDLVHLIAQPGSSEDAKETANLGKEMKASWIVLDGYHFSTGYHRTIKNTGVQFLLIDDNGQYRHYYADVVLNQNLHANKSMYTHKEQLTQLLLGSRYALVRREFLTWRSMKRTIPKVGGKVLVTLGGGGAHALNLKIIRVLRDLTGLEAVVLLGGNDPDLKKFEEASKNAHCIMRIDRNVANISNLMAWADLAVSGAGSTAWELAFMGLPSIVLALAKNQKKVAESLHARKAAVNLGWYTKVSESNLRDAVNQIMHDAARRRKMSNVGRKLVDGLGSARVVAALKKAGM